MTTWGIGQQGVNAYRHQFCSRTLVSQFSWGTLLIDDYFRPMICVCVAVWISMLVIEMCAGPAMKLIQAQPRVQELEAKISQLVQRSRCKTESEVLATNREQQAIKVRPADVHDLIVNSGYAAGSVQSSSSDCCHL